MAMKRIVLVGFPGSGKSTIGKRLAAQMNLNFVDLDQKIEEKYKLLIPDFFAKYGELPFRQCEYELLNEVLTLDNCVISVGGGAPCFYDAMDLIINHSISVYIRLSAKSLHHRLLNSVRPRPLVMGKTSSELMNYIEEQLPLRELFYMRAALCIKGENLDCAALTEQLNNLM
jgi:shikimate kinase